MSEDILVRLLGASELEAYLDHMMRLDGPARAQRFAAGVDDHFILSHCLHMIVSRTSLIGVFVDGTLRGAAELEVDDDGATGELVMAIEKPWRGRGLGRQLAAAAIAEARRRGVGAVRIDIEATDEATRAIALGHGFRSQGGRRTVTYQLTLDGRGREDTGETPSSRWWNPFRTAARSA
ncbi:GNAT family N-acetyltransferase [Prosthecomicrobium hirschii]|uniref:GNAT family N-acetyltransferase n=2 Tax=Prosthecodimorpha hirschii TaxID=665126 RepID=UPI00221E72DA|nr:GNAT family N-acetyltransferase [Prosthecomicrobium hirschii]MCW1842855.1 GNAT family N-acetyltransferase [Prosthecomicrobium hirschii]